MSVNEQTDLLTGCCGTFLGDERHLAGQLSLQPVPVVPLLYHLSLHLPHLELGCVHDVLQRRLAAGQTGKERTDG